MKIHLSEVQANFQPWRPGDGQVFASPFAFDCETTRISEEHPWITPAYVLGAAFDGQRGRFVQRCHLVDFFSVHRDVTVVMHRAPFDLAVIDLAVGKHLDIYTWVDQSHVYDTQLLHRLYALGTEGHTASGKGEPTLEDCLHRYLGINLAKDTQDSRDQPVRLSYGQWLSRPPSEIEPVYLEYLAKDAIATHLLFRKLSDYLQGLLEHSSDVWGYVSPQWLKEQIHRWGWQTHHIQLRAAIVLEEITARGIEIDFTQQEELTRQLQAVADEQQEILRRYGYLPGQTGSEKAIQGILKRLEWEHRELDLARTPTGKYATSEEALSRLASHEFVASLLQYREVQKLQSTFLDKMVKRRLHPSFDVLKTTGRTSSFGEINAQNLPRDDRVRSCFRPAEGHVFLDADYATIEMATLAQAVQAQFGLSSEMAKAINTGKDLHRLVAACVAGKRESAVSAEERQRAKVINFGKPGGMGDRTLKLYAKSSYGVELDDGEVQALSDSWFGLFPEMKAFLGGDELGAEMARFFDLTPAAHHEHTGSQTFLNHPANEGKENVPHPILGAMCLKVLGTPAPETCDGRPYTAEDIAFFWTQVENKLDALPTEHHLGIRQRRASLDLKRVVMSVVGRASVFTLTGRLRAKASYCARRNTVFQGLAADGAKLALWDLWRAGFRIVNFIHDEVLVEVPVGSNLAHQAAIIRHLMIKGMRAVVPDVQVDVGYAASHRWHKQAKVVFDARGKLAPWRPTCRRRKRE
jgi:hypothetical protein